ncbi:MAG TPA: hypothetical protein VKU01_31350 [Bryobacteraceae bacterium]|nr:hypothetical protein [Bryobacteraceae bacterium]
MKRADDRLTLTAISAIACVLQDVLHEGLGHGVTAWFSGAHHLTISTVALQSDISTRWISANGTLVNLVFGSIFWLLLRKPTRYNPSWRYFLILATAGNFFTGTGYFLFSGVANFGDWAAVIQGLRPHWLWRLGLVLLGLISYYGSMLLVAAELDPFRAGLRRLTWTPYFTEGTLAALGGLVNPLGLFYVLVSALPSTLGANAGLLALPSVMPRKSRAEQVEIISRSWAWIAAGAVIALFFIIVLGRGISWSR